MIPPFLQDIVDDQKKVNRGWITWFTAAAGSAAKVITTSLPATTVAYQNGTLFRQQIIWSGGTVSAVGFSRDNATYYTLPVAGSVVLGPGDYIKLTYSVAPTFTVVPL
jgi:hypothetical protein